MSTTRTILAAAIAAGAILLLAGCSTTAGQPGRTTTVSTPPTTAAAITTQPTELSAALGATQTLTVGADGVSVTAYTLKVVPAGSSSYVANLPVGSQFVGLDVQTCPVNTGNVDTIQSKDRWSLIDSTNGRYEPEFSTYTTDLTPKYPYYPVQVGAGECLRGWIMFETVTAQPVTTVRYMWNGSVIKWTV